MQRELLTEVRADGVVTTRIKLGAESGPSARRSVEAQVTITTPDRQLVWAKRCSVEIGGLLASDLTAVGDALKCALTSDEGNAP